MKRRLFRNVLLPAVFALCCARGLAAQEPCRLERAVAPDYGGVMLGMRPEELARMFPGSDELRALPAAGAGDTKPSVASLGMLELGVRKEEFSGVTELVLTFIGGTLQRMDMRFRQPTPWRAVEGFTEYASKQLALPHDSWGPTASDETKQSRVLDCRGFSVVARVDRGGQSTLSIVDTTAAPSKAEAHAATPPAAPRRADSPRGRGTNRAVKGKGKGKT